jgi:hypothetical protein
MRHRLILIGLLLLATAVGIATRSATTGQNPPSNSLPGNITPINPSPVNITPIDPKASPPASPPVVQTTFVAPASSQPLHDLNRMPPLTRAVHQIANRGAEWMNGVNNPVTGRFMYGWITSLNVPLEGDHYLHQAGAAFALARAARYYGDERYTLKARQAVLSLMAETALDTADPTCRHTTAPALAVNRLAAAGLLLMAIHELPTPAEDLLKQGDELANFIRKQQRADGAFRMVEGVDELPKDSEAVQIYPAMALNGLMLNQRHSPAAWKNDAVRKALPFYYASWKAKPNGDCVPLFSSAFTEAYILTKETPFAACVLEMADWICGLQYTKDDAPNADWVGGFKGFADGKPVASVPTAMGAKYLEGLAAACRVARQVPDAGRLERYKDAATNECQFLSSLQFTEDSTRHYAPNHRPLLLGGFHTSPVDGNLCITANQHTVAGMIQYLTFVADR